MCLFTVSSLKRKKKEACILLAYGPWPTFSAKLSHQAASGEAEWKLGFHLYGYFLAYWIWVFSFTLKCCHATFST